MLLLLPRFVQRLVLFEWLWCRASRHGTLISCPVGKCFTLDNCVTVVVRASQEGRALLEILSSGVVVRQSAYEAAWGTQSAPWSRLQAPEFRPLGPQSPELVSYDIGRRRGESVVIDCRILLRVVKVAATQVAFEVLPGECEVSSVNSQEKGAGGNGGI